LSATLSDGSLIVTEFTQVPWPYPLRTPPQTDATLQMAVTTLYLARILRTVETT